MALKCELRMPDMDKLFGYVRDNARYVRNWALPDSHKGKSVSICGAGPSLNDHLSELCLTDETWACNGALTYLKDKGIQVTHGFSIDQGEAMLGLKEWGRVFDVPRYIATSINPQLRDHLRYMLTGAEKDLIWFHNYLGIDKPGETVEAEIVRNLLPKPFIITGHGLNSAARAVCLALAMGFSEIKVYGADSAARPDTPEMPELWTDEYRAWMNSLVLYADGRTAGEVYGSESPMAEAPDIDGRRWHTRPDMIISAIHLIQLVNQYSPRVKVMGDTMVTAMMKQPPEWWTDLPVLRNDGVIEGFGNKELTKEAA